MVMKALSVQERIAQAALRRSAQPGNLASNVAVEGGVFDRQTPPQGKNEVMAMALAKTGPGAMIQHLKDSSAVHLENQQLKNELAQWDGASPTRRVSPDLIVHSKYANRNESSFHTSEFKAFKLEIESAGGNIQPIKVRPIVGSEKLEVIFGHRRHRACKELGIDVLVLVEDANDQQLFEQMDRENRQREDLRPYEQGKMYNDALAAGLYPSMRNLCMATGANLGDASVATRIARMPADVLNAFNSPLDIQYRWGKPLGDALEQSPELVLEVAREIGEERAGGAVFKASEVFNRLVAKRDGEGGAFREINWGHKVPMKIKQKGDKFSLALSGLDPAKALAIEKAVLAILKSV